MTAHAAPYNDTSIFFRNGGRNENTSNRKNRSPATSVSALIRRKRHFILLLKKPGKFYRQMKHNSQQKIA